MVFATLVMLVGLANAEGSAYRVIHDFKGSSDGWEPAGVPVAAANGDLYGVTIGGGTSGLGTVFKLTAPRTRGGAWEKTILYDFPGGDGGGHPTSLVLGPGGNLYGVDFTQTLFELKRPASQNGMWTYTALYTLNQGTQGSAIQGIALDAKGNIYGATELGGDLSCGNGYGCGTVFELQRPTKDGGQWVLSVLHAFTGNPDGREPFAGVTLDQEGNVYGTTLGGGTQGTVYMLSPPAKKGGKWTETVLYPFNAPDLGTGPGGPVTFDGSGNMYGTTLFGGDLNCSGGAGCGVVFELSPQEGGTWTYANLYSFQGGNDGEEPAGYIAIDSKGSLYSTTKYGGGNQEEYSGIAFRLSPHEQKGGAWTETVLHRFKVPTEGGDNSGLIWGKWGDLYGVTYLGGTGCQGNGCGTVFELQP
jgi:uncharacterized repeat protein (TIGR03803 family)